MATPTITSTASRGAKAFLFPMEGDIRSRSRQRSPSKTPEASVRDVSAEVALDGPAAPTQESKTSRLLAWIDLPSWQQEGSHYIETGYRPKCPSLLSCYKSWGYLHNESVNIYSHLIGATLFGILPIWIFTTEVPPRYAVATTADICVCVLYFVGVSICFILSTTFHTIMCHSSRMFLIGIQLDFLGVLLLMWGATVPLIYYGFYCDPKLQWVYWSLLTGFALACAIFTFRPQFRDPHLRPLRAATFGSFALSSVIPVVHAVAKYGWNVQVKRMGLIYVFVTLSCNSLGAIAYATKFPEKWFRRTFDIFGASHQILHIMVIAAGLSHTFGLLEAFDFLHGDGANTCRPHLG